VTLLRALARALPVPARNFALQLRERRRLGRVPAERCETAALARRDEGWLRQVLTDPVRHAEWPAVAAEMAGFSITAAAGGVNPGDRRALYYLMRSVQPARVLEVGTHIGASTAHIAVALRANAAEGAPAPLLVTVDIQDVNNPVARPWEGFGSTLAPAEIIRRLGMTDRVCFVASPSLSYLATTAEAFDVIFLDGDHSAATVYREVPAALRRLAPGGIILLHDYFPGGRTLIRGEPVIPGPFLALSRLRQEGARLDVLPLGELDWPTKLGGRMTSLALVVAAP
jgi:predicted O-methyltransferase YrrM